MLGPILKMSLESTSTSTSASEVGSSSGSSPPNLEEILPASGRQSPVPWSSPCDFEHLEFTDRVTNLRLVASTYNTSKAAYSTVRGSGLLGFLALLPTDIMLGIATSVSIPVLKVLPVGRNGLVDRTLCKGLDVMKCTVPCVDMEPKEIAMSLPCVFKLCDAVKHLQKTGLEVADGCFQGPRGKVVIRGLNDAAHKAEHLLDCILPNGQLPPAKEYPERLYALLITVASLPLAYIAWIMEFISPSLNGNYDLISLDSPASPANPAGKSTQPNRQLDPSTSHQGTQTLQH